MASVSRGKISTMVRWNSGLLCVKLAPLKKSMKYPRRQKHVARSAHIIAFEIIDYQLQYFDRGWLNEQSIRTQADAPVEIKNGTFKQVHAIMGLEGSVPAASSAPGDSKSTEVGGTICMEYRAITILMFAYFDFDFAQPFLVCAGPEQNALQKIFGLDPPKVNEVEKFEEGLGRQFHSGIHQTAA